LNRANETRKPAFNLAGNAVDRAEENRLLQRAQAGEREAFGRLVQHYWPHIFRWLYGCTGVVAVAEDLTQEVFLKAWGNVSRCEVGEQGVRPWLFRIAANALVDWRRRSRTQRRIVESCPPRPAPHQPDAQLVSSEFWQKLWQAVNNLPVEYRMALLLRVQEGLSFREIGDLLNTTEETARWRVFRARALLLRQLGPLLDGGRDVDRSAHTGGQRAPRTPPQGDTP
jgi:RNA polymerase sigma-70 factor (ECF subfamily)